MGVWLFVIELSFDLGGFAPYHGSMADSDLQSAQKTPAELTVKAESWLGKFLDSGYAKLTGAIATLGAGAITARDQIDKAVFKAMKKLGAYDDLLRERVHNHEFRDMGKMVGAASDPSSHTTLRELVQNHIINQAEAKGMEVPKFGILPEKRKLIPGGINFVEELGTRNQAYRQKLKERNELMGLTSVRKKWGVLAPHEKRQVAITAGAATAVALGAVLAIAASRTGALQHEELGKEHDEPNKQR